MWVDGPGLNLDAAHIVGYRKRENENTEKREMLLILEQQKPPQQDEV